MPTVDATITAGIVAPRARLSVRNSVVMELSWAVFLKPNESATDFPERAARFVEHPEVEERVRGFWGDGVACYTELFPAAERGGVLFERDPERVWEGLAAGAAAPPRFEPFTSETAEDQEIFRARVARLHDDAELRDRWLKLLRDVWATVAEAWEERGRALADGAVWELATRLPDRGTYSELVPLAGECDFGGMLPRLFGEAAFGGHEVTLVPCWLGARGFLVSLADGGMLWSPPHALVSAGPSDETRDRARRFKALGDPTRLAILEAVARRPHTVGELAASIGVAQPTVSNHVRILRDAGLLIQDKGSARRLAPDLDSFDRLLNESRRVLGITTLDQMGHAV